MNLLVVGNPSPEHIGAHIKESAGQLGVSATILDTRLAAGNSVLKERVCWHLLGHRPAALRVFNNRVLEAAELLRPEVLLATGIAPLTWRTLRVLKQQGVILINYQTDDPWNPANRATHFWGALPLFDLVFSPRRAAIHDLVGCGCKHVEYLPFAYNPTLHFVERAPSVQLGSPFECDVLFIGGADRDRVALAEALNRAGLDVALYGGYWGQHRRLKPSWRGFIHGREMRWAVSGARVNLVMGRRANRDDHAMRSYEVPAMGGVMVVEDSSDHRTLFGIEGEAVHYYRTEEEMVRMVFSLRDDPCRAAAMAAKAHERVVSQRNTYRDRLQLMLELADRAAR